MPTLTWIGKEAVENHHNTVRYKLLKEVPDLGGGDANSGNLLVQGDNLEALKALLPYYGGMVKCIYIDPPYNTGSEKWCFNDNVKSATISKWFGEVVGKEGETLDRHDRWLCMMYPRLVMLHKFLRNDGAIFISIDDNEIHALRFMMNEIFGPQNYVECITWNKRIPKNDAGIGNIHEYVLVYRKSSDWDYKFTMKKDGLERVDELLAALKRDQVPIPQAEARLRKLYKDEEYDRGVTLYNSLDEDYRPWGKINMSWPNANTFGPRYIVNHPKTCKPVKIPERGWRWTEETFQRNLEDGPTVELHDGSVMVGRIWFGKDERLQPSSVKFLHEVNRILLRSVLSMKSDGGIELEQIFGEKAKFAYPKPTSLIRTLLDSIPMKAGDVVFDSFGGSGTTAHAVLALNREDGIDRKFVVVEMEPPIARDLTARRIKSVVEGYTDVSGEKVPGLGRGFSFCELDEQLFDERDRINPKVRFGDLARHVYFCETGVPLSKKALAAKSPLLGVHNGKAVCLLYNGILQDKSVEGGNALSQATLGILRAACDGLPVESLVVYGTSRRLTQARLDRENVVFKQIPYSLKTA